jgi:hypothetical protein
LTFSVIVRNEVVLSGDVLFFMRFLVFGAALSGAIAFRRK